MWTILFTKIKEVIVGVIVKYMEVGLKRSADTPFTMMDKLLMVMGEMDLGLRPDPLTPIIQVCLVDNWVLIVRVMTGMDIGLIPAKFLRITMVDYILPTQGFLKKLFEGV